MLTIQPSLVNTGASGSKVAVSIGLSSSSAPATSGYTTFQFVIRWDPQLATVSPSSIRLVGNSASNDVTTFDATQISNGILSAGGFGNFVGTSPLVTFDYTQSTLAPVNFAVTKETFNSTNYLSNTTAGNILQVALNSAGQSITPPPIDTTAPTASAYSPTPGSTLTTLSSNITVTFSETVQKGTGAIELRSGSATGTLVESFDIAGSPRVSLNSATLTLDPLVSLQAGTTYFVVFPAGSIKDITGNSFAGTSSYSFLTAGSSANDTTPPTLNSWSPSGGSTVSSLSSNLIATFSETITKKTGTIELHSGTATGPLVESFNLASSTRIAASGNTLTIDPTANLLPATTYVLVLPAGGVQDTALNALVSNSVLTFQTASATVNVSNTPLVAATDAEKLSVNAVKSYFPSMEPELVSQSKLGASLVLSADMSDDTSLTKILPNRVAVSGSLADKATALSVTLPAQIGLDIYGPTYATSTTQGANYFSDLIESVLPNSSLSPADKSYKNSILGGVDALRKYSTPTDLVATKLFNPSGNASQQPLAIKGSDTTNDFAVVNMLKLNNAAAIQVDQVSHMLALGAGRITVVGESPTVVLGDPFNQTLIGGYGNDVLGGGGGNDYLVGGAGEDTFLLGGTGHVTVSDFAPGDVMKFNVLEVKSVSQLAAKITRATEDSTGITITVGTDLTVTLTGLWLNTDYTESMFAFGS